MAKESIRILFIDDSPDDVEQASNILRQGEYVLKTNRVEDLVNLDKALSQQEWDLVLCENTMAKLDAHQALSAIRKKLPHTPFIVLTRKIGDSGIQEIMGQGASEVLSKEQWGHLLPVVKRELQLANERRSFRETNEKHQALETQYRAMIDGSKEAVGYCHEGMHVDANPAYLTLFGYQDLDELKGMPLLNLISKDDHPRVKSSLRKADQSGQIHQFSAVNTEGKVFPVEVIFTPVNISGEDCVQVSITDVSKRKGLEDKLQYLQQHDRLTGLFNRAYFMRELDQALKDNKEHTLVCVQINDLMGINHGLGHVDCDKMLFTLARHMREILGDNHILARIRSAEFIALIKDCQKEDAEKQKQALESKLKSLPLKNSAGNSDGELNVRLVTIDQSKADRKSVLDAGFTKPDISRLQVAPTTVQAVPDAEPQQAAEANTATPEATSVKLAPKSTDIPLEESSVPLSVENEVSAGEAGSTAAFDENNLSLMFQPIINLQGEPADYFEVIPYIEDKPDNYVPVSDFIRLNGNDELAGKLNRLVIQQTINLINDASEQHREVHFFINISTATLKDEILPTVIEQHLKTFGLAANKFYFIFNADDIVNHTEQAKKFIAKMKKIGAGIVINDFDNVKIDKDILKDITIDFLRINSELARPTEECNDDSRLRNAFSGAVALKKQTIVYGVEDAGLFSSLYSLGTHYVQGDYLHPVGPDIDVDFAEEQTLDSVEIKAPNWTAST